MPSARRRLRVCPAAGVFPDSRLRQTLYRPPRGYRTLVMESGCPDNWVIGALLHALHQHRVPFESGLAPEERRVVLADRFGTQVAELVRGYTSFESEGLGGFMGDGQR